jgi:IS1 family transposase
VLPTRTFEQMQEVVDQAPRAQSYFSDGFPVYADLYYHGGQYQAMLDKSQTYAVEAVNAELRHYVARLRRQTRCYSKCLQALRRAVAFFVRLWNAQQLHRRAQPYALQPLVNFVSLRV